MELNSSADGSKIFGKAGWIQVFKAEASKSTENFSSIMESESQDAEEKVYKDFDENNTKEYEAKIDKNPGKAKIISRGQAIRLNGIWQFLKKDFPSQANLLRKARITKTDSESDFIQSMKSKLLEEINKERLDNQHKFCQKYNF